ncbi:hypothetical protein [uncultured Maribacter sp.]|uniref:hypothetical protein n=1 Tax=uncultured Maribacter sp. TaxID=431308 RepID=UPI0030DA6BB2
MHKRIITLTVNPEIDKSNDPAGISTNTKLRRTAIRRLQNKYDWCRRRYAGENDNELSVAQ